MCFSKGKTKRRREVKIEVEGLTPIDGIIYEKRPPKFELTRRRAICSVMEEELQDQRYGISLANMRKELILRCTLSELGLLQ